LDADRLQLQNNRVPDLERDLGLNGQVPFVRLDDDVAAGCLLGNHTGDHCPDGKSRQFERRIGDDDGCDR
jgi:hypothetical protein